MWDWIFDGIFSDFGFLMLDFGLDLRCGIGFWISDF